VAAQSAPFNEVGVTIGHWDIVSKDVEAKKTASRHGRRCHYEIAIVDPTFTVVAKIRKTLLPRR
jgi:hypothetical protein